MPAGAHRIVVSVHSLLAVQPSPEGDGHLLAELERRAVRHSYAPGIVDTTELDGFTDDPFDIGAIALE